MKQGILIRQKKERVTRTRKPDEVCYYRCSYCGVIGLYVTNKRYFKCATYRCEKGIDLKYDRVAEGDYRRMWGLDGD